MSFFILLPLSPAAGKFFLVLRGGGGVGGGGEGVGEVLKARVSCSLPSGSLFCLVWHPGPRGLLVPLLKWWALTSTSSLGALDLCLGPGAMRVS